MCKGKLVRFTCPNGLVHNPNCPTYNKATGLVEPFSSYWVESRFQCCAKHAGPCQECPLLHQVPGNIELKEDVSDECDKCALITRMDRAMDEYLAEQGVVFAGDEKAVFGAMAEYLTEPGVVFAEDEKAVIVEGPVSEGDDENARQSELQEEAAETADAEMADLEMATLMMANLEITDSEMAGFSTADFSTADFSTADFPNGVDFSMTNFEMADLEVKMAAMELADTE